MGMAEDGKFGDGYEAIFGKKSGKAAPAKAAAVTKPAAAAKKPAEKKPAKKK
jgi:ribosomal protein L9